MRQVSSDYVDAFNAVIKHYSRIAESLTRFDILKNAFNNNAEFQNVLAVFYSDILRFHKEAYKFVRRSSEFNHFMGAPSRRISAYLTRVSGWHLFFDTSWGRFRRRFDDILANLKAHEDLLDKTANAINIAEARDQRAAIEQRRKDQLEEVAKQEESKASQQYWEIVAWLKVDQTDQSLILDCITEEALKHSGGCDWILKIDNMKSWMRDRPDTPFLWLQGNPGSGKSVLAAQIVSFLQAAHHSLVISHFCTYSYASSTRYDLILRSLLLQLIEGNQDLVAYVHRLKETELANRSVTPQALEKLIQIIGGAVSQSPGETKYVHIVLDGLDECEEEKQGRLIGLLERLASTTGSSNGATCKVLLLSRASGFLKKRFRKKATISLTEEKPHLEGAIRSYAGHRLGSLRQRLFQMGISDADIKDMAATIAQKADGEHQKLSTPKEFVNIG